MDKEKNMIMGLLQKYRKRVSKLVRLKKIILFGSRARGDSSEDSDVDVLMISEDFEGKKYFKRSPELYGLWDWSKGYEVDIICLTPEEFRKKKKESVVIKEAAEEGVEIK